MLKRSNALFWSTLVVLGVSGVLVMGYFYKTVRERNALPEAPHSALTEANFAAFLNNPSAQKETARLFINQCAACHGSSGNGGVGVSFRDAEWKYGGSLSEIEASIIQGRIGMPRFGGRLQPVDIEQLAMYVKSFSIPQEPKNESVN
ncbi:MAG: cytochrome c [Candidatus Margulisiibacteriota bacterium]